MNPSCKSRTTMMKWRYTKGVWSSQVFFQGLEDVVEWWEEKNKLYREIWVCYDELCEMLQDCYMIVIGCLVLLHDFIHERSKGSRSGMMVGEGHRKF